MVAASSRWLNVLFMWYVFIALSLLAFIFTALLSHVLERVLSPAISVRPLTAAYEVALLIGGPRRVLEAALASMLARCLISVQRDSAKGLTSFQVEPDASGTCVHEVERALMRRMPSDFEDLWGPLMATLHQVRETLVSRGFLFSRGKHLLIRLVASLPCCSMGLGGTYFLMREWEYGDRAARIGAIITLLHWFVCWAIISRRSIVTRNGQRVVSRIQRLVFAPRLSPDKPRDEGVGARAAMAVALAGTQALLSSGYNLLYQTFTGKESVPPSDGFEFFDSDAGIDVPNSSSDSGLFDWDIGGD